MFTGVITALVTPLRGDAVDEEALRRLVDEQIASGVDGLVPVGTTGESPTLTNEEHLRVIQLVVEAAKKRVPVIAGTGLQLDARDDRDVGRSAQGRRRRPPAGHPVLQPPGAGAPLPPLQGGRRGGAAAEHPLQRPRPHGVRSPARDDRAPRRAPPGGRRQGGDRLGAARVADPRHLAHLGARSDRVAVLSGDDATAFPLFALGARGVISVVSNVAPAQMSAMWDAAAAGDWKKARELHYRLLPLGEGLFVEANPMPVKAALAMMGRIAEEIRPPLYPLAAQHRDKLRAQLQELGLL